MVILSDSPNLCSETVYGLISSIYPVIFNGDYHPYFTIFDTEFNSIKSNKDIAHNYLLGVTNPLFTKTFANIGYFLRLDDDYFK